MQTQISGSLIQNYRNQIKGLDEILEFSLIAEFDDLFYDVIALEPIIIADISYEFDAIISPSAIFGASTSNLFEDEIYLQMLIDIGVLANRLFYLYSDTPLFHGIKSSWFSNTALGIISPLAASIQ